MYKPTTFKDLLSYYEEGNDDKVYDSDNVRDVLYGIVELLSKTGYDIDQKLLPEVIEIAGEKLLQSLIDEVTEYCDETWEEHEPVHADEQRGWQA